MSRKTVLRLAAATLGISGLIVLLGVLYPLITYESDYGKNFSELISPLSEPGGNRFSNIAKGQESNPEVKVNTDFSKASNWFVGGAQSVDFSSSNIQYYTVSIPRLRIEDATVAIGGEDLNMHLVQYPGTALPGRPGNTVIFGHSILPIFYNPKNYISIFSLLPTLKMGDEITVDYDGIVYQYNVEEMFEVSPTDIQVLDQDPSDSFLTLVTCVPPGHPNKPRRLIVRARVIPPQ